MMMDDRPMMRCYVNFVENSVTEPELDGEDESVNYRLAGVSLAFTKDKQVGTGELIITSKRILWIGSTDATDRKCFDFDVPYIILHAISRDPDSYPVPCLYCQLDQDEELNEEDKSEKSNGDEYDSGEAYFIPSKEEDLQALFDAFSHAALLNPDPLSDDEQDGEDDNSTTILTENENSAGFIFNGEEVRLGASQAATLAHLESVFVEPKEGV